MQLASTLPCCPTEVAHSQSVSHTLPVPPSLPPSSAEPWTAPLSVQQAAGCIIEKITHGQSDPKSPKGQARIA